MDEKQNRPPQISCTVLALLAGILPAWSACPNETAAPQRDAFVSDGSMQDSSGDADLRDSDTEDGHEPDGAPDCKPADPNPTILGHAAGQDCLSCHDNMGADLHFTLAGTAYEDAAGASPLPGATVTIVDDTGKVIDLKTGSNGNFYSLQSVTFPINVVVSRCPNLAAMPQPLSTRQGCNSCHGEANRIHLP